MRLKDLNACLLWRVDSLGYRIDCPDVAQAQGVMFLCPKCFNDNKSSIGTHSIVCWFVGRGVPDDMRPGPGRWTPSGSSLDDLTFVAGSPPSAFSVLLPSDQGGCGWHGYVKDGDAT